jgi:hypothetical protein
MKESDAWDVLLSALQVAIGGTRPAESKFRAPAGPEIGIKNDVRGINNKDRQLQNPEPNSTKDLNASIQRSVSALLSTPRNDNSTFRTAAIEAPKQTEVSAEDSGGMAGAVASTIFRTGLGSVPLVLAISRLFGGGKAEEPPSLIKYSAPPSIRFDGANVRSQDGSGLFSAVDYDQSGKPRLSTQTSGKPATWPGGGREDESNTWSDSDFGRSFAGRDNVRSPQPQINIHVQAMDSKSFSDHSYEIAQAVREAMLNMHSLNDVVSEV